MMFVPLYYLRGLGRDLQKSRFGNHNISGETQYVSMFVNSQRTISATATHYKINSSQRPKGISEFVNAIGRCTEYPRLDRKYI